LSPMDYSSIRFSTQDRLALLTMNRPERRNALDDVMIRELADAFTAANRSSQTRMVILTGEGAAFCAGMDLEYLRRCSQLGEAENLEDARNFMKLLALIHGLKKPVLAMVNGPALGGGCGLAAACDFVFASKEKARIGVPEVRIGFLPAIILLYLVKRMGEGAARELVLRGDILTAERAQAKGLVTEVVEADRLTSSVMEFAGQLIRSTSGSAQGLTKELFARYDEMDRKHALEYAANLNALSRKTEDFKKGIEAFIKKEGLEW
jgi:methylglutaconyl-CoA hydratase